ncbi:putative B3 domain-containing protein REM15 [Coffea eugenioides]|uniref:putative B3 domain-containing protein REM15 n=1 Tax=Coffea eugenioides TaxID=49369 RepID=UPI000F606E60|nr:putative B3 domain-containing protein REM15 [Coffea eugenioides]
MAMRNKIPPEKPHFFKPILPGFEDGVKIPDSFLKYLDGKIPQNQAVLRRGDEEWRVKISDQFLREGWRAFAVENELHVGDFVVFEHEENMVFEVLVFDPSHCERQFPSIDDDGKGGSEKSKAAEAEEIPRSKKVKLEQSDDQEESDSTDQICCPYFISTVKPSTLLYHRLHIPMDFVRANGLRKCNMMLRDQREILWTVKLNLEPRRAVIKCGCKSFLKAQEMKEGDEFMLELIRNGETPVFNFYAKEGLSTRKSGHKLSSYDKEPGSPQFISTIEPHCIKRRILYFPMEFARSNNLSDRSCDLILRDPKKRVWHVELKARGRRVYIFCHGLDEFFTANGLKEGDACKFELVENGKTPIINFLADLTKDDQPQPQPQPPSFMKTNSKNKAKRLEASSEPENDDHTSFVSTIKPYNLKKYVLRLPMKFARRNGLTEMKGDMIIKDEKQRLWKVKFEHRANGVAISRGWGYFSKANGLKVGDRFKFEIIKKGKRPVMNFHCNFPEI